MKSLRPDLRGVLERGAPETERFVELVRTVRDPSRKAVGYWNVGDVAAHVSHVFALLAQMVDGKGSPIESIEVMSLRFDEMVAGDDEREPKVLADRIQEHATAFLERAAALDSDVEVEWHARIEVPVSTLGAILLEESLLHGYDIARAEGRAWSLDPRSAALAIQGFFPLLPYFVDSSRAAEFSGTFDVKVRGGPRAALRFEAGSLTVEEPGSRRPDVRLSVDPVSYLLVGFNRASRWPEMARGNLVAWGRKPWLALKLTSLIRSP